MVQCIIVDILHSLLKASSFVEYFTVVKDDQLLKLSTLFALIITSMCLGCVVRCVANKIFETMGKTSTQAEANCTSRPQQSKEESHELVPLFCLKQNTCGFQPVGVFPWSHRCNCHPNDNSDKTPNESPITIENSPYVASYWEERRLNRKSFKHNYFYGHRSNKAKNKTKAQRLSDSSSQQNDYKRPHSTIDKFWESVCLPAKGCNSVLSTLPGSSVQWSHPIKSFQVPPTTKNEHHCNKMEMAALSHNPNIRSSHSWIGTGLSRKPHPGHYKISSKHRRGWVKIEEEPTSSDGASLSSVTNSKPRQQHKHSVSSRARRRVNRHSHCLDWGKPSPKYNTKTKTVFVTKTWDRHGSIPIAKTQKQTKRKKSKICIKEALSDDEVSMSYYCGDMASANKLDRSHSMSVPGQNSESEHQKNVMHLSPMPLVGRGYRSYDLKKNKTDGGNSKL